MNRYAFVFILFLAFPAGLCARPGGVGLFNSPKGFGVSYVTAQKDDGVYSSIDLYSDIYGFPIGRAAYYPGLRLQAFRNSVLKDLDFPADRSFIYAGLGCSVGYVRDFEPISKWATGPAYLIMNMGGIVCVSGALGMRAEFDNIVLDLGFQADAGLYLRKHEYQGNMMLELYKNGLYNCLYPQLKIMWKF